MFPVRPARTVAAACLLGLTASGCIFNKGKKEVADAPAAPPPAAYPDSGYQAGAAGSASAAAPAPTAAAPATAAAPQAPQPFSLREGEQLVDYEIQTGDNLSAIATKFSTTVGRIKAANGMTSDTIYAGRTLKVPTMTGQASSPGADAGAPSPPGAMVPQVHQGPSSPADAQSSTVPPPQVPQPQPQGGFQGGAGTTQPQTGGADDPASTSYPRTQPQPQQPGAFPTPSFSGGY